MGSALPPRRKHAAVTGGAGFVGSSPSTGLPDARAAVTCMDGFGTGRAARTSPPGPPAAVRRVRRPWPRAGRARQAALEGCELPHFPAAREQLRAEAVS